LQHGNSLSFVDAGLLGLALGRKNDKNISWLVSPRSKFRELIKVDFMWDHRIEVM
jgi:hypothetical protein